MIIRIIKKIFILTIALTVFDSAKAQHIIAGNTDASMVFYKTLDSTQIIYLHLYNDNKRNIYDLDMNDDGISDVSFLTTMMSSQGSISISYSIKPLSGNLVCVNSLPFINSFESIFVQKSSYILKLRMNDTINNNRFWYSSTSGIPFEYDGYTRDWGYSYSGNWTESPKYMGLKLKIADKFYFGWVKLGIQLDILANESKISFYDCAISNISTHVDGDPRRISGFEIYPNPATNIITIEQDKKMKESLLTIFNLNSQVLISQKINGYKTEIDISNLSGGIYFVKLVSETGSEVQKIIKE